MTFDVHMVISAIAAVLMLLLSVIAWFAREKLKEIEERVRETENRQHQLDVQRERHAAEVESVKAVAEAANAQNSSFLKEFAEFRAEFSLKFGTREDVATLMGRIELMSERLTERIGALEARFEYQRGERAAAGGD